MRTLTLDSTARLSRRIKTVAPVDQSTAYRDRNVFRPERTDAAPVAYRSRRVKSPTVIAVQAAYRAATGKRLSYRAAKALLAIRRANAR